MGLCGGTTMNRLTKRDGDMVYYCKDGSHIAPMAMSGQDVRQALQRLADFEDGAISTSDTQIGHAFYNGYQNGYIQGKLDDKKEKLKPPCAYCGGRYTVVDNDHNKYVADGEMKYCFHCGRAL